MKTEIVLEDHKWCSNNTIRSAQKWGSNKLKDKYHPVYTTLIKSLKIPKFDVKVDITVYYNSRLDPDNVSGKFFVDALVSCGVIENDNKKFVGRWMVEPVLELKSDTYIVVIKEFKDGDEKRASIGHHFKANKRKAK
jgi:hypothetical protein